MAKGTFPHVWPKGHKFPKVSAARVYTALQPHPADSLFVKLLKATMIRQGLKPADAAKIVGMPAQAMWDQLKNHQGRSMSAAAAQKILAQLGVELSIDEKTVDGEETAAYLKVAFSDASFYRSPRQNVERPGFHESRHFSYRARPKPQKKARPSEVF